MHVNFTIRIPRDLYERMKRHREIRWSEVIRRAIEEYLEKIEEIDMEEGESIIRRLGIDPADLEVEPPQGEDAYQRERREREWRRLEGSTTRAQ